MAILKILILTTILSYCQTSGNPVNISTPTLQFQDSFLIIQLTFNQPVNSSNLNLNNFSLSNSPSFDTICTFSLNLINPPSGLFTNHDLLLSQPDSERIITTIGENATGRPCLVDSNSTFLALPSNFTANFSSETVYPMLVIPDTNPPFFSFSQITVNLLNGLIVIPFTELIDTSTLNLNLFTIDNSPFPTFSNNSLTRLVNAHNATGFTNNYTIKLEIFELPYLGNICGSGPCSLQIDGGSVVSDVFGNTHESEPTALPTVFTPYAPFIHTAFLAAIPHSPTQERVTIFPPLVRTEDVITYRIYLFPLLVHYYTDTCDSLQAYFFQLRNNITQWAAEDPTENLPPCVTNAVDYSCVSTLELNTIIDIFPGYDYVHIILTVYPQIQFNTTAGFFEAKQFYDDLLQFNFEADNGQSGEGSGMLQGNETEPSALGNRILVTWVANSTFCDNFQLTIKYGEGNVESPSQLDTFIHLDRRTCLQEYVYIYAGKDQFIACPEIRINTSQIHVPDGNCVHVVLNPFSTFINVQASSNSIDIPVITSQGSFNSDIIFIDWNGFTPSVGYTIEYYNVYIFPVYALQFNGGACSNIDSQTSTSEFTFLPTEYYRYGISIIEDFDLTCPPPPGLTLPYNCSSLLPEDRHVALTFESTYAVGIIIEAITRQLGTNIIDKVYSYPINHKSFFAFSSSNFAGYHEFEWNPQICQASESSLMYVHLKNSEGIELGIPESTIYRCSLSEVLLTEQPSSSFFLFSSFIIEVSTPNGPLCLSGYESNLEMIRVNEIGPPHIPQFRYLDYETMLLTIYFNGSLFNTGDILTIPTETKHLQLIDNATDSCPPGAAELPPYELQFRSNTSISDQNNLTCVNTGDYFCESVNSMNNITLKVIPGFDPEIRVVINGVRTEFFPGRDFPFHSIYDSQFIFGLGQTNTNTTLVGLNNILVEWNTQVFCPKNSYISIAWMANPFGGIGPPPPFPPPRSPRGIQRVIISDEATMPCDTGSYLITDLVYNSFHDIQAYVFHNSTASFFQVCPVINFIFFPGVATSPLLTSIDMLDFSRIQVTWQAIQGVTTYTLIGYPVSYCPIGVVIEDLFDPSNVSQGCSFFINHETGSELFNPFYTELCLNSSETITCSMVTISGATSVILPVVPGYTYELALAFDVNGNTQITGLGMYSPRSELINSEIEISGFNDFYTYRYNNTLCTPGVRTTAYYDQSILTNNLLFPVDPCASSPLRIDLGDEFNQHPRARMLFIFPFINVSFPDVVLVSSPAIGVFVRPPLSSHPLSAIPTITNVTVPAMITSNNYQVFWTPPPNFPNPQQLEFYIIYAYPGSASFGLSEFSCPLIGNSGAAQDFSVSPPAIRDPLTDLCPSSSDRFYFCGEYTSLSGDLALSTLLDYDFYIEAVYSGELRTHDLVSSFSVTASQNLSSLDFSFQVTQTTITINWNTQPSFCSGAQLNFLVHPPEFPENIGTFVACSVGNYTAESLLPFTSYLVEYFLLSNVSSLQQGTDGCIQSLPNNAFGEQLPQTTSFLCIPLNPCGAFGECSEGFSNSSYHCACLQGFRFDGTTCVDIDECALTPNICPNGACLNSIGNFTCTCFEGFEMLAGICQDINECEIAGNCFNGNCTNLLPPNGFFVCECDPGFQGVNCDIPEEIPTCPSVTEPNELGNNITFPATEYGAVATISCSLLNMELFGNVTRRCSETGEWEPIDLTGCQRIQFQSIQVTTTMSAARVLTAVESEELSEELVTATNTSNGPLFPGEVQVTSQAVDAIAQSLTNLSSDATALRQSLDNVQDNVVETTSNVLREDNSAAFEAVTEDEAETLVANLVDAIQVIGILIGSAIGENETVIIEITQPTVALIITVVRNVTEPLVLGSNLSMPVGGNASALAAAQTSVSIPAAVIQGNDDGEGIEVSVSLFSDLFILLRNVNVSRTQPTEPDSTIVSDRLASSLTSINLFTRGGSRITELTEPISITFVLLNNTPIVNNDMMTSQISCVSSPVLSQGWTFDFVILSNPDNVPPGPALCTADHLTHFGVLVSVTSQNFSQAETLALEILTYITCSLSIICLILSIAAYSFLWYKTRKQQGNLFKKDASILHMNFAIALLLALVFFLASSGGYGNDAWCTTILIIQYYFWLSVFSSSLSIGIYLLIKIFAWSSQRRVWYYMVALTWTMPLPLIIITPAITHDYILNREDMVCFFSKEPAFANLSFIIPMAVISAVNLVILIITGIVLFRISHSNKGMLSQMLGIFIASFTLSPILGIVWLFSVVTAAPTSALSFIFTILLGLQGVLFAVLYPLRTPEIIEYFRKYLPQRKQSSNRLDSSTSGPRSSNPPAALKFRVKRADRSSATKSTTLPSKADISSSDYAYEKASQDDIVPEPHYIASLPEKQTYLGREKSVSPPPYESLDERETRL